MVMMVRSILADHTGNASQQHGRDDYTYLPVRSCSLTIWMTGVAKLVTGMASLGQYSVQIRGCEDCSTAHAHCCVRGSFGTGAAERRISGTPLTDTGYYSTPHAPSSQERRRVSPPLGEKMSEEVVRQTRSQKRALERETPAALDGDTKRVKVERGELGSGKVASILNAGEVKATIKVEVQACDEPVDMSTSKSEVKKERPPTPDDVIVLSDNEPSSPCMNGISHTIKKADTEMLMKSSPEERQSIIKQLKEELRVQEAKLVLLKKLRQSQIQKESVVQKTANSTANPPPLVRGSISSSKGPLQVSSNRSSGTVIPPPLVRGGAQASKHGSIVMPPLVRGSQPIAVTPQQIATLRQQQQQQHSGSGPPPLLLGPRTSVPNVQVQGQRIIQQGLIRVANVANTNVLVNIPQGSPTALKGSSSQSGISTNASAVNANDSPASRQAAAKLALRKQLEKTLLEIPPPKPPAPELNFLPSAANNEFIYLVGLEMVVQNLLDLAKSKQQAQQGTSAKDPYTCAQCQTDFTSRWRQEKGNNTILCEQCMSSNQKKALKAEHTNRLKAAFVKALQQEQEIEQRILQQAASPSPKTSSSSSSSSSPVVKSEQHVLVSQHYKTARASLPQQASRAVTANRYHSGTIKQSPGQLSRSMQQAVVSASSRGLSHGFSTSSQLQNAITAAALVSRPGKHAVRAGSKGNSGSSSSSSNPAASAWRKQNSSITGVTMAYVNPSLSVHKTTSPVDRQREYLLDMIPSRSISQTTNTWKQ